MKESSETAISLSPRGQLQIACFFQMNRPNPKDVQFRKMKNYIIKAANSLFPHIANVCNFPLTLTTTQ